MLQGVVFAGVILAAAAHAEAQNSRSSFFLQMLRSNSDSRVKVTAVLRLAELRDPTTVPALMEVLRGTHDAALQATIVSALGTIGVSTAIPAIEPLARGTSDLALLARRTVTTLQARSGSPTTTPSVAAVTSTTTASSGASSNTKLLVTVSPVSNTSGVSTVVVQAATQAIQDALSGRGEVLVHSGSRGQAEQIMRAQRLIGHSFTPNLRLVQPNGASVHVELSIAVSSYPGGALEFDSPSSVTITSSVVDPTEAQQHAVRVAMQAAVGRAVTQLMAP